MKKRRSWIVALTALFGAILHAQDIAGDWQGTLKAGASEFRFIAKIAKGDDGAWKATVYSPDQGGFEQGITVDSVTLQGSNLKLVVGALRGAYEGKISADGASIAGAFSSQQGPPLPLELQRATPDTAWKDLSPHTTYFVTVDKDVKLQVLDWGGSGRPVVLLTGLGDTAHQFDRFAPKLTGAYHVYGITRRGFGTSSAPAPTSANYSADRLGDDVLAAIDSLKLNRPVLVGHSLSGEELSSVGSRHPERVAGLIYLDAGYSYAYYDRSRGDLRIDVNELHRKLEQLQLMPQDPNPLIRELLETSLPALERDLRERPPAASTQPQPVVPPIEVAVLAGMQKYTDIRVPILAIYALPHDQGLADPAARAAADAKDLETTGVQAKAFETGLPSARVVRLPHAGHYVFQTNEADVLREMNAFIGSLP
jgi:non-heme chloroperoxidase